MMNDSEKNFKDGYQYYCDSIGAAYSADTSADALNNEFEYIFQQKDQIGKLISEINEIT